MAENQFRFWKGGFGDAYAERNTGFDPRLEERAWQSMLRRIPGDRPLRGILECGCNTGRNLHSLRRLMPEVELGLIELHEGSFRKAVASVKPVFSFNGPIAECPDPDRPFDLVFTSGVLIHVHPDELLRTLTKMYQLSSEFILVSEYFNRTPVSIPYHGEADKLFKRDFGGFALDHLAVECLDYGFLWGREFDRGGFDDITWWLFRKL